MLASVDGVKLARILDGATTYVGLEVDGLAGDLVGGGSSLTLHLADGQALFNSVDPAGTKLGWATLDSGILPFAFSSDLTRDVELHLSGAAAVNLAGVAVATATSISADHTTASGDDGNGITLTGADVWAFRLGGATVFVGTGGSLVSDSTHPRLPRRPHLQRDRSPRGRDRLQGRADHAERHDDVRRARDLRPQRRLDRDLRRDPSRRAASPRSRTPSTRPARSSPGARSARTCCRSPSRPRSRAASRSTSPARSHSRSAASSRRPRTRSRSTTRPRAAPTTPRPRRPR